jgi:hypothetical protein
MTAPAISTKAGTPASSTISLSSTSGTGRVYLSCTTTAPKASCSINSGDSLNQYTVDFSKSGSGNATVNVATAANTAMLKPNRRSNKSAFLASAFAIFGFVVCGFVFFPTKWSRSLRSGLGGAGLMLALVMHPGCGGGGSSAGGGGGGGSNGTPPGTYSVTVNAYTVSNSTGNPDSAVTIPLTVN